MAETVVHPPVASEAEWRKARLALLDHEKELTKHYDRVNAERRRLPMVKIEKTYTFDTPDGKKSLLELFKGKRQLIVYHFMFGPDWQKGCPGCTWFGGALGDLSKLGENDTGFVMVSRAPLEKLLPYKAKRGWKQDWVSSFGSDFNYDFHVTIDPSVAPVEYNYRDQAALEEANVAWRDWSGEQPGMSAFALEDGAIYHTYSTYARGLDAIWGMYAWLDRTPLGRNEVAGEGAWWRRYYAYEAAAA